MIWSASFSFNLKEDEAWSIIMKQLSSHKSLQLGFSFRCWRMWDFVSVCKCSLIVVSEWRLVSPKLRDNKDILITKLDKDNGVIIVNRAMYLSSLYEIINGTSKFLKLPSDPAIGREGKLQRFLPTLNKKDFFSKEQYKSIYPSSSQPAML